MAQERFPRIPLEVMTPRQREVAQGIAAGPRGEVRGPYIPLLHNPDLAERLQQLGEHLRFGTGLPGEVIELAVLITARAWDCQYEWFAHRRIALVTTNLAPAIMDAVAENRRPTAMPVYLEEVYDFCRELQARGEPGEGTYDAIEARYGKQGTLDLIALCGYYAMLAMVLNTARISLPDGVAAPLAAIRRA